MVGRGGRDPIFFIPSTYGGITKISFLGAPEVGEKQCMGRERRRRSENQWPAIFVNATTGGTSKTPGQI